jgi:hypothetical protein
MLPKFIFRVLIASVLTIGVLSWWVQRQPAPKGMTECTDPASCKEQKDKQVRAEFPIWESLSRHLISIQK